MEMLLQQVTDSNMMSMLGGLFGYNQVLVAKEDMFKIAFVTVPWETYILV
jgi:hypothetical protein